MSLMGVKKINKLKECTRALPGKGDKPKPPVSSAKPSTTATSSTEKPTASTVYQSSTVALTSCAPGVKCNGGGDHTDGPTAAPTGNPASGAHGGHPVPTTTSVPTGGVVVTAGSQRISAGWVAAAMGAAVALL
jgi:hypothetical protein